MHEEELEKIAERSAKKAVQETLRALGVDVDNPLEVQQNMAMVTRLRKASERGRFYFMMAVIGILVSGLGTLVWDAITRGGK